MGKAGKTKRALERQKRKRSTKDARKQQYERWRDDGINQKSKRSRQSQKRNRSINVHSVSFRNRRTTHDVMVIKDGKTKTVLRGGTITIKQFRYKLYSNKAKGNK